MKKEQNSFDSIKTSIIDLLEKESQEFIFLTGAAGTGKSTMLEHIRNQLDLKKMIVAPTGVAALNIGGNTINSAFRIGFETIPEITKSKDPRFGKLLKNLELLIIDEISMVRAPMLDAISQSLQIHRNSTEPFGGVSVLACGDLFQLPPVVQTHEESTIYSKYNSVYFFDALSFKDIKAPIFFELTKSFRQEEDDIFYELLNNVRLGINLEDTVNRINKHCYDPTLEVEPFMTLTSRKNKAEDICLDLERIHKNKVYILRLPGIFGKGCKPNYNSVVATFCYNVANNQPLKIINPNKIIDLIFIDDLCEQLKELITKSDSGQFIEMRNKYKISIKELAKTINEF